LLIVISFLVSFGFFFPFSVFAFPMNGKEGNFPFSVRGSNREHG
jgi:hypothetical protein